MSQSGVVRTSMAAAVGGGRGRVHNSRYVVKHTRHLDSCGWIALTGAERLVDHPPSCMHFESCKSYVNTSVDVEEALLGTC